MILKGLIREIRRVVNLNMKSQIIQPIRKVSGIVKAPGSKSVSNRVLIITALAEGVSRLDGFLLCEDTENLMNCLSRLGVRYKRQGPGEVAVYGGYKKLRPFVSGLDIGASGTAMRFICSFLTLVKGKNIVSGDKRMLSRPMEELFSALKGMGASIKNVNCGRRLFEIRGDGYLPSGEYVMPGARSSQFFSSLLLCSPYSNGEVSIKSTGQISSESYIDLTIDTMADFGVKVKKGVTVKNREYRINPGRYKSKKYLIEGDYSNASYFMAAAAISRSKLRINNLLKYSDQGDKGFINILKRMGCRIAVSDKYVEVVGNTLKGINVDMNKMPDIVPTLAVLAVFAKGKTRIRNIAHLRIKESDRISVLALNLRKFGVNVKEYKNEIIVIHPKTLRKNPIVIDPHNDHRMAMAFSLMGFNNKVIIKNPACVDKSFPEFFKIFKSIIK